MREPSGWATSGRDVMAALVALLSLGGWSAARGQTSSEPALKLQDSPLMQERINSETRAAMPVFISGQSITGRPDMETVVEGQAVLRKADLVIRANRLEYNQSTDTARATGEVRINRAGNVYEGPLLELRLDAFEGFFNQPSYHFLRNDAHGEADRVDFVDEQRTVIHNATFTTCKRLPGADWMPDWILKASRISFDNSEDTGTAEGAYVNFKGVPVLAVPYLSFPLGEQRKSGLLPPTLDLSTVNGTEVSLPFYWNIAPNRDATITPSVMTKRGVNLGTEFRYLEPSYTGVARLDWMPADKLRDDTRWGLNLSHQARIQSALTDNGLGFDLSLNRVSDNNYWRDFTHANDSLTQRLLANDAKLNWSNGAWQSSLRTLKWQTLQDVSSVIVPPYDRLPQLATHYARSDLLGLDVALDADYTQFQSDSVLTGQPNAERGFTKLQISEVFQNSALYLTPKLQLHATHYRFDAPLADGARSVGRVVPTLSLDTGLVFERDTEWFGRAMKQTLEPRAFYVNTPFRDQSLLPNYDSGAIDFNLATIFSENAFVGDDRISDSNLLTLGVIARFLDPVSGAEAARVGMAQRLRFRDQRVTLLASDPPVSDRLSDMLFGGSVQWDPRWSADGTIQFNPDTHQSVRSTLGGSYNPGDYRTVTAAYRFQRGASKQLDVGWQWPINDLWGDRGVKLAPGQGEGSGRWYSVGRLNYSINDRKLVDSVLGFEYDAGCWLGRLVFERLQTSSATATQHIMFQLEFVGFSRLGINPLKSLKDNIPNYQYLREPGGTPSRFSNYD